MGHFVPHTDAELSTMLADIGLSSLDQLFEVVPEALRLAGGLDMAPGLSEPDVLAEVSRLASRNRTGADLVCFAGAGAYDHEVPSATTRLTFRSEFVTAYTPYQPEVAQGVLQALFEYQTLVARLAGLPVANASLYDGASAAVEAVNLAVAAKGRQTVWVSGGIHPHWRQVMATYSRGTGHHLVDVPLRDGVTDWAAAPAGDPPAALLVGSPNYLGALEDVPAAKAVAAAQGALLLVAFDPVSAGLLRAPGEDGADVVVGEGQPFGTPMSFGGPYLGLFTCRMEQVRRLPGRLVGRTVDTEGRPAYVTTLRAREQDIRREKASSNVCTNQTLMAVAAMIQLSWLGTGGLRELALRCARGTALRPGSSPGHPRGVPAGARPDAARVRPPTSAALRNGGGSNGGGGLPRRRAGRARRRGGVGWGRCPAGRGDRAAHPRGDRRFRSSIGKGGAVMAASPARTPAPGGRATSAPVVGRAHEPTIFEYSSPGRQAWSFRTTGVPEWEAEQLVPTGWLRDEPIPLTEVSERDLVAHVTRLTHRQYSVDLGAYPLGSCTMKYNPKLCDDAAAMPGLTAAHPAAPRISPKAGSSCCGPWGTPSAASPGWPPPLCSRRPVQPANSPGCCSCGPTTTPRASPATR